MMIWIQVRDIHAEHARLAAAGISILRKAATEPWGMIEMWIEDPDGIRIVLVEFPPITVSAVTHKPRHRQDDDPIRHESRPVRVMRVTSLFT